jgi:hypothetical protein
MEGHENPIAFHLTSVNFIKCKREREYMRIWLNTLNVIIIIIIIIIIILLK